MDSNRPPCLRPAEMYGLGRVGFNAGLSEADFSGWIFPLPSQFLSLTRTISHAECLTQMDGFYYRGRLTRRQIKEMISGMSYACTGCNPAPNVQNTLSVIISNCMLNTVIFLALVMGNRVLLLHITFIFVTVNNIKLCIVVKQ